MSRPLVYFKGKRKKCKFSEFVMVVLYNAVSNFSRNIFIILGINDFVLESNFDVNMEYILLFVDGVIN